MKKADLYSLDRIGIGQNMSMSVKWIDRQGRYAYYIADEGDIRAYYWLDTRKRSIHRLFDNGEMARLLEPYADSCHLPTPGHLGFRDVQFNRGVPFYFQFEFNGKWLEYSMRDSKLKEVAPPLGEDRESGNGDREYSADSLYYVTVRNHNLILGDSKGDTTRLTSDGEADYSFSSDDPDSEGDGGPVGCWIGNSHQFLAVREDTRRLGRISIIDSRKGRPVAKDRKYVAAGDKEVLKQEFFVIDAKNAMAERLNIEKYPDQKVEVPLLKPFVTTNECAYFTRLSRTCDSLELCCVDAENHSVCPIISEVTSPHLNEQLFGYHVLHGGNEILWWSERSGRGQIFLYDGKGRLKNPVTNGDFVAGHVVLIDEKRRYVIVEGYGGEPDINPHYRMYYKASLDGGNAVCLTPENGYHTIDFSPNHQYIYDRWSRMDMPEKRRISDLSGKTVVSLPGADIREAYERGWRPPQLLEVMAADSVTKLYGMVFLPFDREPGKKYPVISNVYPGPHDDLVPLRFSFDSNENMMLAQLGFVVIQFSHRGSCPVRGKDYYNHGYGNLRDYALEDDMAIIRQIAERYDFVDLDKVGIYGHSGGGFMTAAAMLKYPDFYKVGVSASGNHDNNIYYKAWSETYHGVTHYKDAAGNDRFECHVPTTVELAGNLKGNLLLVHGEMDDNVHPASTLRLADALIQADKRFDMFIIPGADHGLPIQYFNNLVRYYFVEKLLGLPQSDIDIVKHE